MSKKRRLGKGLSALIGEEDPGNEVFSIGRGASSGERTGNSVAIADIVPNRHQPRRNFDRDAIRQLADSIKSQGLIQPLVLNDSGDGGYELISGERRLRAVRTLGWKTVPAVIKKVDESALLEMSLVENLQREDLDPIEEAEGYQRLADSFGLKQAQIAQRVGKDRSTVANSIRLLRLPEVVRRQISAGKLSAGHARQLLALDEAGAQIELARRVIDRDISVRKLERLVREWKLGRAVGKPGAGNGGRSEAEQAAIRELEDRLRRAFGTKVRISSRAEGKGKIEIEYYSYEEFERLLELFDVQPLG
ncbi:MAG: ParB/RepB/Spo0J family partition protein [Candidatus Glassbacteria bacterium]|nr:ParB/RepB/Spo0J family partition protein [Candidatus Glassbacteria bacterium]